MSGLGTKIHMQCCAVKRKERRMEERGREEPKEEEAVSCTKR